MIELAHTVVDMSAKILELIGAAIILGSVVLASLRVLVDGNLTNWRDAYGSYRAGLGRGILLGLELLVGADIISTITAPLTFESVGLLGAIIAIRTFLSFSLETEIEGCWPWRRLSRTRDRGADAGRNPLLVVSPEPAIATATCHRHFATHQSKRAKSGTFLKPASDNRAPSPDCDARMAPNRLGWCWSIVKMAFISSSARRATAISSTESSYLLVK